MSRSARREKAGGRGMQERHWITVRRSELEAIVEELAKRAQEVQPSGMNW
ncbi:hypothetical protein [Streptomyces sp. NPDC018610]